ncbi:MAG: hypothetical protein AB7N70_07215 [Dehalococcoidia bacterium]
MAATPKRKEYTPFDAQKKAAFLTLLAEGHTATHAARACGVVRATAYAAREHDPDFADAWAVALEDGVQILEQEARRRAVDGVTREKAIYHQGIQVGTEVITEYSDSLLMFLLKAKRPEVYRDRTEVKHSGQVNHAHAHIDVSALSTAELRTLDRLARKALTQPPGDPEGAG